MRTTPRMILILKQVSFTVRGNKTLAQKGTMTRTVLAMDTLLRPRGCNVLRNKLVSLVYILYQSTFGPKCNSLTFLKTFIFPLYPFLLFLIIPSALNNHFVVTRQYKLQQACHDHGKFPLSR